MKTSEFIARYSYSRRVLTAPCEGITLHVCRAGGRYFGAVECSEGAYLTPFHSQFAAEHFQYEFARECYAMAEAGELAAA